MNRDQILETIKSLAKSQGLYGRILDNLNKVLENYPDEYEKLMEALENMHFKDVIDLIMYFEE